jgi:cytochrome c-type biogenesis protein CcsB
MTVALYVILFFYVISAAGYFAYLFFQKDVLYKIGFRLLTMGFVCHTTVITLKAIQFGGIPLTDFKDTLCLCGWAITGFFIGFQYKFNIKVLGVYAAPIAALIMFVATWLPSSSTSIQPVLKNVWLITHVAAVFIGDAAFALACGIAILYLTQERAIKTKRPGFFFKRLPSLELLDSTAHICIITGFTLLSLGLITGFIYAKAVWGKFWSWDPKEVWSCITWLLYASLLHGRITTGWRGRKSALMAIIGFALLMFTFLGVNFLLKGHHVEFTRF